MAEIWTKLTLRCHATISISNHTYLDGTKMGASWLAPDSTETRERRCNPSHKKAKRHIKGGRGTRHRDRSGGKAGSTWGFLIGRTKGAQLSCSGFGSVRRIDWLGCFEWNGTDIGRRRADQERSGTRAGGRDCA